MTKLTEGLTPEQIEQMAELYSSLVGNPETRNVVLQATKRVNPKLSIPEIDVQNNVAAALKARDDRIAKLEENELRGQADARIRESRRELKERGFEAKDVEAIEKLMLEKQIPSYTTAAEFYEAQQKLAEPTPEAGRAAAERERTLSYRLPTDPLAALKGGPKALVAWGRESAAAALDDLKAGRVKVH